MGALRARTSGPLPIASPAASCERQPENSDDQVPPVTSVAADDLPQPTSQLSFHEAIDKFARELLTQTLISVGGERAAVATVLRLNRTHLQQLIRKLGVEVPPDLRLRGRRREPELSET